MPGSLLLGGGPAFAKDPGGATNGVGANVTLSVSGTTATLGNGVITAAVDTTSSKVTSYLFYGTQMHDTSGLIYYSMDGGTSYEQPANCVLSVTTNTADMVDISCKVTWANNTNRVHDFVNSVTAVIASYQRSIDRPSPRPLKSNPEVASPCNRSVETTPSDGC